MPNRVLPGQEKILPLLSFKVPIEITFSICTTENIRNELTGVIANLNKDFSAVCKNEILFRDLKLKTKLDVDNYCADGIKLIKDKMYKDLGICRQKSFGSDYMIKELVMYVNLHKKKVGLK